MKNLQRFMQIEPPSHFIELKYCQWDFLTTGVQNHELSHGNEVIEPFTPGCLHKASELNLRTHLNHFLQPFCKGEKEQ